MRYDPVWLKYLEWVPLSPWVGIRVISVFLKSACGILCLCRNGSMSDGNILI